MMNYIFTTTEIASTKKKNIHPILSLFLIGAISVSLSILLVLFREKVGNIISIVSCSLITSFSGCFIYYVLSAKIFVNKRVANFMETMLSKKSELLVVEFVEYKKACETRQRLTFDVLIAKDETTRYLYLLKLDERTSFVEGMKYQIMLVDNYVIGYEKYE